MHTSKENLDLHNQRTERAMEYLSRWGGVVQVSYPRSGKEWSWQFWKGITGYKARDPNGIELSENLVDYLLFPVHGFRWNWESLLRNHRDKIRAILLVRDPRDSALSLAYRWVVNFYPDAKYHKMCPEVVDECVDHTIKVWNKTIRTFLPLADIVLHYEEICRNPDKALGTVCKELGFEMERTPSEVLKELDESKAYAPNDAGRLLEHKDYQGFNSSAERFDNHCGKWLRDRNFTTEHNRRLYSGCSLYMELLNYHYHGYAPDGNDSIRWI